MQLLKDGCAHMRKAFDIENLNLDDLIDTVMNDKKAVAGEIRAFRGIKFDDLHIAYKQFCKQREGRAVAVRSQAGDRVLQQASPRTCPTTTG